MYVYAVRLKRKSRRIGVALPQYSAAISSFMDMAVRSERPMKAKRIARKEIEAEGDWNSRGIG